MVTCRKNVLSRHTVATADRLVTPLISIVVPVYNEARTVADVIQRLIAIDLPAPREILVVNDGSTDGTREVLDQIVQRPELRIIHAEKNGGKGSAIRIGFARATGTIVAIQDADLELDPAQIADWCSRFSTARPPSCTDRGFLRAVRRRR